MKLSFSAVSLALALSIGPALAERPVATYKSDADHTFAFFEYSHLGYSFQRNRFDDVQGTVVLDLPWQTGQVDVTIKVDSVHTGSGIFDDALKGEQFFDAANHPAITYRSSRLEFGKLDNLVGVDGNVTIKGVTKPLHLEVTHFKCMMHPMKNKPACGVNATGTIKRSDFDLGKYVPFVGDDVKLFVVLEGIQQ
ncbi:MAG: YceI family protein [Burkholderiales bacterium]